MKVRTLKEKLKELPDDLELCITIKCSKTDCFPSLRILNSETIIWQTKRIIYEADRNNSVDVS